MSQSAQIRIRDSHSQLSTEMAMIYRKGVGEGVFRPLPPYLVGRFIQDTIMSAASTLIEDETRLDEVTSGLETFLLGGLGNWSLTKL